jgi:hypothetical protein
MPVDRDGYSRSLASTERIQNLWGNLQASHGLRRLDVGSKPHHLLLQLLSARRAVCAAPPGSERCGVPRELVRIGEGPKPVSLPITSRCDSVPSGQSSLDEGTAPEERAAVRLEEPRDAVVLLDLPAEASM